MNETLEEYMAHPGNPGPVVKLIYSLYPVNAILGILADEARAEAALIRADKDPGKRNAPELAYNYDAMAASLDTLASDFAGL